MEITVQFGAPLCSKHQMPFQYICMAQRCICQLRLCYQCAQEHYKQDHPFEEKRFDQYQKMVQRISKEDYDFLDQYKERPQMLNYQRREQSIIQSMKMVKEMMIQDKVLVANCLKQFKENYEKRCTKLNNLRYYSKHRYLYKLKEMNLTETVIHLTNQVGLDKLHSRIKDMRTMAKCYQLYLEDMNKYGENYNTFVKYIGLPDNITKNSITCLLKKWNTKKEVITQQSPGISQKTNKNNDKSSHSNSNHGKQNKKTLSPGKRKINVVTPPKKTMKRIEK